VIILTLCCRTCSSLRNSRFWWYYLLSSAFLTFHSSPSHDSRDAHEILWRPVVCVCVCTCLRFSVLILDRILDLLLFSILLMYVFLTTYSRRHMIPARRGEFYCIVPVFCFLLRLCCQQNLLQNDRNNLYLQLKMAYHNKDRDGSTDWSKRKVNLMCGWPCIVIQCG